MSAISSSPQVYNWNHTNQDYVTKLGREKLQSLINTLFQKTIVRKLTSFTPKDFEFTLKIQDGYSTMIVKDEKTQVNLLEKYSKEDKNVIEIMNLIHDIIAAKEDEECCSPVTLESPKEDQAYEKEIDHYKELMAVTTFEMARFRKVAESTISRLEDEIKDLKDKFKSNKTLLTEKVRELETANKQINSAEQLVTDQLQRILRGKEENAQLKRIIQDLNEEKKQALLQLRRIQRNSTNLEDKTLKRVKKETSEDLASALTQAELAREENARTKKLLEEKTKEFNTAISQLHAINSRLTEENRKLTGNL